MNTTDVISKARAASKGKGALLLFIGFVTGLIYLFADILTIYIPYLPTLLIQPIWISMAIIYLKVVRYEKFSIGDLGSGFKNYVTNLLTVVAVNAFTILWSILFVIPGLIKYHSYAMAPFIIAENPNMKPLDAITKSRKMMDGHKMQLFMAYLMVLAIGALAGISILVSVIFLAPILGAIAMYAGFFIYFCVAIALYPLYYTVVAQFYIELSGETEAVNRNDDFSNRDDVYYNDNAQEKLNSSKNLYYEDDDDYDHED